MSVTIHLPGPLREFAGGRSSVTVAGGGTVSTSFDALFGDHPELKPRILTDTGHVRRHVNVFVGSENIRYLEGLDTPIEPGGDISIVPAVSGG